MGLPQLLHHEVTIPDADSAKSQLTGGTGATVVLPSSTIRQACTGTGSHCPASPLWEEGCQGTRAMDQPCRQTPLVLQPPMGLLAGAMMLIECQLGYDGAHRVPELITGPGVSHWNPTAVQDLSQLHNAVLLWQGLALQDREKAVTGAPSERASHICNSFPDSFPPLSLTFLAALRAVMQESHL